MRRKPARQARSSLASPPPTSDPHSANQTRAVGASCSPSLQGPREGLRPGSGQVHGGQGGRTSRSGSAAANTTGCQRQRGHTCPLHLDLHQVKSLTRYSEDPGGHCPGLPPTWGHTVGTPRRPGRREGEDWPPQPGPWRSGADGPHRPANGYYSLEQTLARPPAGSPTGRLENKRQASSAALHGVGGWGRGGRRDSHCPGVGRVVCPMRG